MRIEITDLPQGRKVKHINVDITFEEDGTPDVKTTCNPDTVTIQNTSIPTEDSTTEEELVRHTPPVVIESTDKREQKEIPEEMKTLEF